jgi:outer membrane receptor protein involved in Fe transport
MSLRHPICYAIGLLAVLPLRAAETVTENAKKDEPVMLSIFQVTDDMDEGYRSTQTTSGSRTLANLRDTPNSISVLNREFLDDLMATKLSDALFFSVTGEIDTNTERSNEDLIFRGMVAAVRLRNGVTWWGATSDTYNIERGEVLRGPQAFLYGEGTAGGVLNQQTKRANSRNSEKATFMFGTNDLYRAELDVNRRLSNKVAARIALVAHHENAFQHYTGRDFYGAFGSLNYRPFRNTNINFELEYRLQDGVMPMNTLTEQYTTTERTPNTFTTLSATTGGRTFLPALGVMYDTVGRRRSSGIALVIDNERIWPRELNFLGPDSMKSSKERSASIDVEQRIGENFNVALNLTYFDIEKYTTERAGGSAASVYRDINPTLPSGAPNPYFNELYTEYQQRRINSRNLITSGRLTAVYDLKLPNHDPEDRRERALQRGGAAARLPLQRVRRSRERFLQGHAPERKHRRGLHGKQRGAGAEFFLPAFLSEGWRRRESHARPRDCGPVGHSAGPRRRRRLRNSGRPHVLHAGNRRGH